MTRIEWCDDTWNPVTGCPGPKVSPGCANCYAEAMAVTRLRGRFGYDADDPFGIAYHHDKYTQPLHWRKNRYVFVNSMGDLFHPDVRAEELDAVFAVILACLILNNQHDHAFIVLTKRPDIMAAYFAPGPKVLLERWGKAGNGYIQLDGGDVWFSEYVEGVCTPHPDSGKYPKLSKHYLWPLPNLWLGVTACTQKELDEKTRILRSIDACYNRVVSLEPLLERVVLPEDFFGAVWQCEDCGWLDHGGWPYRCPGCGHTYEQMEPVGNEDFDTVCPSCGQGRQAGDRTGCPACRGELGEYRGQHGMSWVICGGETGPKARPMHPDWVRSLRDQCAAHNAPFFFKSWGEWQATTSIDIHNTLRADGSRGREFPNSEGWAILADGRRCIVDLPEKPTKAYLKSRGYRQDAEPGHYIVDQRAMDEAHAKGLHELGYQWMYRVGKKRAGRLLDGVEHVARPLLHDHQHRNPIPF